MKCPKCENGFLEEWDFDKNIGECGACGCLFTSSKKEVKQ